MREGEVVELMWVGMVRETHMGEMAQVRVVSGRVMLPMPW